MTRGARVRPGWMDLLVAGGLTLLAQLELQQHDAGTAARLISLVITGSLVLRRTAPLACTLVVAAAMAGQTLTLTPPPQVLGNGMALLVAGYSLMAAAPALWSACVGLGALALAAVVFERAIGTPGAAVGDIVMAGAAAAVGWYVARRRTQHEAHLAQARVQAEQAAAQADLALGEERRRIARELHDVISHAITVVVLQARGGRVMLDSDPAQTRGALDAIEQTAQQALAEMRRLVILLREPMGGLAPQPGLADLPALAAAMAPASVTIAESGQPTGLTPGADLTAFRLVQESLTNAARHSPGQPVEVSVVYNPDTVSVSVRNPVRDPDRGTSGSGLGLLGLRERVELYGGTLEFGPSGGFWQVVGTLPARPTDLVGAPT